MEARMVRPIKASIGVSFAYGIKYKSGVIHKGVDFSNGTEGNPVMSCLDGTVEHAALGGGWGSAYGQHVIIKSTFEGKTKWMLYGHLKTMSVKAGAKVKAGQQIGTNGGRAGAWYSGNSTGAHVHVQAGHADNYLAYESPWPMINSGASPAPKPPTPIAEDAHWVTTADLNGRDYPGTEGKILLTNPKGSGVHTVGYADMGKVRWYITSTKVWFCGTYLKAKADAPPAPPVVKALTVPIGQLNICVNRITAAGRSYRATSGFQINDVSKGKNWSERLKLIPALSRGMWILTVQEAGQIKDCAALAKAMGPTWVSILHGDGDLSTAILYDSSKVKAIKDGSFATTGRSHKEATWAIFEELETKRQFLVTTTHLIDTAQGSDALRGRQMTIVVKQTKALAGKLPYVITGDLNIVLTGKDPVSHAIAGLKNTQVEAKTRLHTNLGTTNQLKPPHTGGHRYDYIVTSPEWSTNSIDTIYAAPATDHNEVQSSLTLAAA